MTVKRIAALILALSALLLCACSEKPADDRVAAILDGEDISADEVNYYIINAAADLSGGNPDYWSDTSDAKEKLSASVRGILMRNGGIEKMCDEYKLKLEADDKSEIKAQLESMRSQYESDEAYIAGLAERGLTEYSLRRVLEITCLWQKLYDYTVNEASGVLHAGNAELLADIPLNFVRATHILIKNDEGEDPAKNRDLAESLLQRARDGEDFFGLVNTYSEDEPSVNNPNGYYFTHGQMLEPFESASFALEEYEISDIIESKHGYHIIIRLPIEDEYVTDNIEELRDAYKARLFAELLDGHTDKVTVEFTEIFTELLGAITGQQ